MTDAAPRSWNPFNCAGTELPINVLLMAKLMVVAVVFMGEWSKLPERYLPMLPFLDHVPADLYEWSLKAAFALAAAGLLLNRNVRICCLVLGLVFLFATLGARGYYRNSKVFTAAMFLMTGLQKPGGTPWLFHAQFALMYFGSGLNKLFEADWRDGQYFEHWTHHVLGHRAALYVFISDFFPERWFSLAMGWLTIVVEMAVLPVMILMSRLRPFAVWFGIAFHGVALFLTRQEFGIFYSVLLIAYLSLVTWPAAPVRVRVPRDWQDRRLRRLDTCGLLEVKRGEPPEWQMKTSTGTWTGFRAVQRIALLLPPLYLVGVFLLTAPGIGPVGKYLVTAVGFTAFFPLTAILLDRVRTAKK